MGTYGKVFIVAPVDEARETHRRLEEQGCALVLGKASWDTPQGNSEAEMIVMARDCDALRGTSIRNAPISRAIMGSSERLRIVAKYTIGTDDVDVEAATELGILVAHSPTESNWGGVAEGTIAAMLAMLKKLRERDRLLKESGGWRDATLQGTYLGSRADGYTGITLGLIGLGRIGSRIATLLRPWKMRILATDPYVPEAKFAEHGVTRVDLPALLRELVLRHRSEEHTSELQSQSNLVCRLLLEKKKYDIYDVYVKYPAHRQIHRVRFPLQLIIRFIELSCKSVRLRLTSKTYSFVCVLILRHTLS